MKINKIIIHHSLTKDSKTVSWNAIRKYHINVNKWLEIGYHFGIETIGEIPEIFIGRMPDTIGAHCYGHNKDSLGICFVGNFDKNVPPLRNWIKGVSLVKYLLTIYPDARIVGHRELNNNKSCPGKLFSMDKFRKEVKL